jgi:predicted nucleic acid-binding OB-fold protein
MLSFYFTFFELLNVNKSFVVLSLNGDQNLLNNLMQLSSLRNSFKKYVSEIIEEQNRIKIEKLEALKDRTVQEAAWIQLLITLKFWLDDDSAGFEKTDLFIEKSVTTTFEMLNITALESLIDFGKFIFKEKIQDKF